MWRRTDERQRTSRPHLFFRTCKLTFRPANEHLEKRKPRFYSSLNIPHIHHFALFTRASFRCRRPLAAVTSSGASKISIEVRLSKKHYNLLPPTPSQVYATTSLEHTHLRQIHVRDTRGGIYRNRHLPQQDLHPCVSPRFTFALVVSDARQHHVHPLLDCLHVSTLPLSPVHTHLTRQQSCHTLGPGGPLY